MAEKSTAVHPLAFGMNCGAYNANGMHLRGARKQVSD